ncbi:hypothetical protein GCG21_13760 [Pseudactinotalea sp. HY160]|uniref:hypothetical protein n=1 Tax=Pseudactinotalea sp. HY160 TaxID=2654490 RepID=UPI00128C0098|nr:hypothetical protein [Pseudactinotalea sp. HY160]MPV51053.1 hypothetical protein [Pseudactinotalea sp. HY160]
MSAHLIEEPTQLLNARTPGSSLSGSGPSGVRVLRARLLAVLALLVALTGLGTVPATAATAGAAASTAGVMSSPAGVSVGPAAVGPAVAGLVPMAGGAADAQEPTPICGSSDSQLDWVKRNNLLPISRWSSNMSFHSRTGGLTTLDFIGRTQRDVLAGQNISMGNMLWSATSGMSMWAVKFCPLDMAGHAIDQAAGKMGDSLTRKGKGASALFVGLFLVTIVVPVVRSMRRGGPSPLRLILPKVLIAGLLVVMVNGAMSSTDSSFGKGSPGWLLAKANETVNAVAGFPATLEVATGDEVGGELTADPFSCKEYLRGLNSQFQYVYGGASEAAMPRILNSMWEATGLAAWKTGQFGNNVHGDNVYCRLLDELNGVPVGGSSGDGGQWAQTRVGVMAQYLQGNHSFPGSGSSFNWGGKTSWNTSKAPAPVANSIAFAATNDATRDVSLVGWALCTPSGEGWKFRSGATGLLTDDPDKVDPNSDEACAGWWTLPADPGESSWLKRNITGAPNGYFESNKTAFNWEPDKGAIAAATAEDPAAQDFLLSMHSNKAGSSTTAAAGFVVSAAVTLIVFGGLSFLVIAVKAMSLLLILTMLVALMLALLPGEHGNRILSAFAGKALGVLLLTAGSVLLFSVVGALTSIMVNIGVGDHAFAPGSVPAMFWTGIAPLAAVLCISYLFKNVLKMPNPLSLKGAGSWLKSSGAIGGAVGGAVGGLTAGGMMRRTMGGAARRTAARAMSSVGDAALHKATGGRMGRAGGRAGMEPLARKGGGADRHAFTKSKTAGPEGSSETSTTGTAAAEAGGTETGTDSKHAGGKGAKLTLEQRQAAADRRSAGEEAILAELGIGSDASKAEKKAALKAYYADQAKEKKQSEEFISQNGTSIRSAMKARRLATGPANWRHASNGEKARMSAGHLAGAMKDVGTDKAKRMAAAFKAHPVKAPLGGLAKRSAKVAGIGLGAAALGPLLPFAAAGYGAVKVAGKVHGASAVRNEERTGLALAALARKEAAEKAENDQAPGTPGTGGGGESGGGATAADGGSSNEPDRQAPAQETPAAGAEGSQPSTRASTRSTAANVTPIPTGDVPDGPTGPQGGSAAPQPAPRPEQPVGEQPTGKQREQANG